MSGPAGSADILREAPAAGLLVLLGICPLLAGATTLVTGIGLGIATLALACATSPIAAVLGRHISPRRLVPALLIAIPALATAVELLVHALFDELRMVLGVFLPLTAINATVLYRATHFAPGHSLRAAFTDAFACAGGMALMLAAVGGLRELIGAGTLFAGADLLLGPAAAGAAIRFGDDGGPGLAAAPAAGFFLLGLYIAVRAARRRGAV